MHIALATSEYPVEGRCNGGLANYIQRTATALRDLGHEPVVIASASRDDSLIQQGVQVELVGMELGAAERWFGRCTRHLFAMTTALARQRRRIRRRLDALHRERAFDLVQYPHLAALGLGRRRDLAGVVRLSGDQRLWQEAGDGESSRLAGLQQRFQEDRGVRAADLVFAPSRLMATLIGRRLGRTIEVLENPFVLDPVEPDPSVMVATTGGSPFLLFVGMLVPVKGVRTIAGALRQVLERHPGLLAVFIGGERGPIDGHAAPDLLRAAAGPHADRLRFTGILGHGQLYPFLGGARAVWLPSLVDNLPNTCLEAMAHARVVVGTAGASFEQLIDEGRSGFLCRIGDPEDLARATLLALGLDDDRRAGIGAAAAERIRGMRPEITGQALIRLYQKAIALHRGR